MKIFCPTHTGFASNRADFFIYTLKLATVYMSVMSVQKEMSQLVFISHKSTLVNKFKMGNKINTCKPLHHAICISLQQ